MRFVSTPFDLKSSRESQMELRCVLLYGWRRHYQRNLICIGKAGKGIALHTQHWQHTHTHMSPLNQRNENRLRKYAIITILDSELKVFEVLVISHIYVPVACAWRRYVPISSCYSASPLEGIAQNSKSKIDETNFAQVHARIPKCDCFNFESHSPMACGVER